LFERRWGTTLRVLERLSPEVLSEGGRGHVRRKTIRSEGGTPEETGAGRSVDRLANRQNDPKLSTRCGYRGFFQLRSESGCETPG
jgi:hypothetical protein